MEFKLYIKCTSGRSRASPCTAALAEQVGQRHSHNCTISIPLLALCGSTMAEDADEYLAVLKASYDYEPQSDEEIAIKEDQLLFLLHKTDEEYV